MEPMEPVYKNLFLMVFQCFDKHNRKTKTQIGDTPYHEKFLQLVCLCPELDEGDHKTNDDDGDDDYADDISASGIRDTNDLLHLHAMVDET